MNQRLENKEKHFLKIFSNLKNKFELTVLST